MQLSVEFKIDSELERMIEKLIEAMQDLATVVAPLTGYRVVPDKSEEEQ